MYVTAPESKNQKQSQQNWNILYHYTLYGHSAGSNNMYICLTHIKYLTIIRYYIPVLQVSKSTYACIYDNDNC